jgi:hypothetical protein
LLLCVVKWFVPYGVKEADDGGSSMVERTDDSITFYFLILRSFVQLCMPILYFIISLRGLPVKCTNHFVLKMQLSRSFETSPLFKIIVKI